MIVFTFPIYVWKKGRISPSAKSNEISCAGEGSSSTSVGVPCISGLDVMRILHSRKLVIKYAPELFFFKRQIHEFVAAVRLTAVVK
jgi:hypothetical protein